MMSLLNLEECELLGDSKYRAYISQVEKALKNFETTSEWADLISALGKLNKVLTNHVKYPVIPKRVTIGKRLAQCLHPALPSGVHLKALETYDIIFKCIGTQRLAADLFTYSAGLFPLLGYGAMNVKPNLLAIYETHFVPLGRHIKPALTGLLMGLLPGLEEGSEHFDRSNKLLEEFCEAADPMFFYSCMWECMLASTAIRLPAINFTLAHFNRKKTMEDQIHFMGSNIDVLIQAMCGCMQDTSVLVQRSALDFLLVGFPMHNSQLVRPDMIKVMTAAIKAVLRRDMSLNRRLYAWLLGTDASGVPMQVAHPPELSSTYQPTTRHQRQDSISTINSDTELVYFNIYSKELLVIGIKACIKESAEGEPVMDGKPTNLRPFRILISLLDKAEIGAAILEDVLIDVIRYMYKQCEAVDSDASWKDHSLPGLSKNGKRHHRLRKEDKIITTEIIKTANLLFGSFEPFFMWDFLGRTFEAACVNMVPSSRGSVRRKSAKSLVQMNSPPSVPELCILIEFLLEKASLETYTETQTEHLPQLLHHITVSLGAHCHKLSDSQLMDSLQLSAKLLSRVLPSMTPITPPPEFLSQGAPPQHGEESETNTEIGQMSESDVFLSADSDNEDVEDNQNCNDEVDESKKMKKGLLKVVESGLKPAESFSDFMKYEDKMNEEFPKMNQSPKGSPMRSLPRSRQESPKRSVPQIDLTPQTLMQSCVLSFQKLFSVMVRDRIIPDQDTMHVVLAQLHVAQDRESVLMAHFDSKLPKPETGEKEVFKMIKSESYPSDQLRIIKLQDLSGKMCEAFSCACQLLVDFSCFPMYCTDQHRGPQSTLKDKGDTSTFPEWLRLLLTCACFVDHFHVQTAAISTMLDLISLTQSVMNDTVPKMTPHDEASDESDSSHVASDSSDYDEEEEEESSQKQSTPGTVSVVIIPSLSLQHLKYLNNHSHLYTIISTHLWNHLSEITPTCHQRSVELLSQLHQLSPNPWVCENVIGNSLLSDDKHVCLDAHKKFSVLWHLLREQRLNHSNPGIPLRTFDRSMFLMLDSLASDTNPCRSLTQTWLTHAIQRGDISRVLEPILLMLLHPDTARISIQHVNIHQPKKVRMSESIDETDSPETKIYAISSEGGNVIYHVSNQGWPFSKKTSEELRTIALTTIAESGTGTTKTSKGKGDIDMPFDRVNPKDLNLRMNPFGSQNSLDKVIFEGFEPPPQGNYPNIDKVKRLNVETCKKEGISFDDDDQEEKEEGKNSAEKEEKEETVEEMVTSILDDLIEKMLNKHAEPPPIVLQGTLEKSDSLENLEGHQRRLGSLSRESSLLGADELLNGVDSKISEIDTDTDIDGENNKDKGEGKPGIHPLHTHILLYTQKYDSQRTLYALSSLKSILTSTPRLVACAMSTTSISGSTTPQIIQLQNVLARHRRSVFGKNFFSEVPSDSISAYRSSMYVEVLISVSLYFIRSYYPNLMMSKLTEQELNGNKEVQILSCEILTLLLSELVNIAKDSGKGFSTYISDLMGRCKVQKALLHCLLASVFNSRRKVSSSSSSQGSVSNITEAIISFNEENMDTNTNETFQIKLLKLILVLILLEDQIRKAKSETDSNTVVPPEWEKSKVNFQPTLAHVRYMQSRPIVYQGMLLSAILSALKQQHHCHMHRHWVTMVTSALPYLGRALSHTVVAVVNQLCKNIELLAQHYEIGDQHNSSKVAPGKVPPDHLVTLLEGLTMICHYCLLDTTQQSISIGQPIPSSSNNIVNDTASAGQILSNLMHVFNPYGNSREPSPAKEVTNTVPPVIEARRSLLSILPRILASLTTLWKAVNVSANRKAATSKEQPWWTMGSPKTIRQQILEFASPVSRHHGINMMGAFAVVWNDRRQRGPTSNKRVIGVACEDQLLLVDLVGAIKVLPTDTLLQTVKAVIKQPPPTSQDRNRKRTPLEVSMLQFFYAYMQRTAGAQLVDSWPSLLALLKDGLQLNLTPPGQFLLLAILNEFVQKVPNLEERKDQKDLQDIAQKLLEACSEIAGASLEQTTWLRRNLAVKPGPQVDIVEADDVVTDHETEEATPAPSVEPKATQLSNRQYSVQALMMLAEMIAPLLDVVYSSEEKDRVVPFLNSIMHHVFPYLRNHSSHNLPSFRACSQILASLSSYQYTRKAWRKECFELLLDTSFFQMDEICIAYWNTIIDNLMTHDKTTFKDLLARVTVAPSGSLNLFSSREQEFELRAQLLKRLSFTLFCSEMDQYQKYMPDIQERLAESLRVSSVPSVQAQVFLCFRVLILRMSPQHLTSLWPTIITELVHILLQIEQEIAPDMEETKAQLARLANLDSSWALGNGLTQGSNPSWLHLYLASCKLLDLALVLPTEVLPQFQLYRWAFTGDPGLDWDHDMANTKRRFKEQQPGFMPHVARIAKLMRQRFGMIHVHSRVPGQPLLTMPYLRSLQDLHSFFSTVMETAQSAESFTSDVSIATAIPKSKSAPSNISAEVSGHTTRGQHLSLRATWQNIEQMVEADFLDPMPKT